MPRLLWTVLDYLFLMRPMLMPPVWTIGLLGFASARTAPASVSCVSAIIPLGLFTILTAGVYVQNQIYDIEGDRLNRKLFLLAEGHIAVASARWVALGCFGTAVAGAWWYAPWLGALMAVAAFFGAAYNMPPFRWKDRPLEGFLYNAVLYGVIVFLTGWGSVSQPDLQALAGAVPYFFGVGAIYLNTTLPDIPGDLAAGKITIGVKYGFRATAFAACLLLAADVLIAAWIGDWLIAAPSLACLPLFVRMAWSGAVKDAVFATKSGVLALSLSAVTVCPLYLALLTVLYFGSKPYYRKRLGIAYPSFRYQR